MPLLKRSGCVISTLPIKTLALAVVLVFLLTESEVTVMNQEEYRGRLANAR